MTQTADDKVCNCKQYFHNILELKQRVVDTVIDQWRCQCLPLRSHQGTTLWINWNAAFCCWQKATDLIFSVAVNFSHIQTYVHFELKGIYWWHYIAVFLKHDFSVW